MIYLPQIVGQFTDLFSIALLFLILFTVAPQLINLRNVVLAVSASVIFSFIDLKYNLASDFLTVVIYFTAFKFEKKTSYWHRSLWIMFAFSIQYIASSVGGFLTLQIRPYISLVNARSYSLFVVTSTVFNYVTAAFLILIVMYAAKKASRNIDFEDPIINKIVVISMALITASIVILTDIARTLQAQTLLLVTDIMFFLLIIIFVVIGLSMYITAYIKTLNARENMKMVKNNEEYTQELESNYNELRKFRHDYKNMLLSLSMMVESHDDAELDETIHNLIEQANLPDESHSTFNNENLYKIADMPIRGLIVNKLIAAKNSRINLSVEVDSGVGKFDGESILIVRILGILFDNAIEESIKSDTALIRFGLFNDPQHYEFIIENSTKKESININAMSKQGASTKQGHSGLGLATVQDLMRQNDHIFLKKKSEGHLFSVTLTVEKKGLV